MAVDVVTVEPSGRVMEATPLISSVAVRVIVTGPGVPADGEREKVPVGGVVSTPTPTPYKKGYPEFTDAEYFHAAVFVRERLVILAFRASAKL